MSKGSKRRPGQGFNSNFDKIDWSNKPKSSLVKIETDWGARYVSPESLKEKPKSYHIMPDIEPYKVMAGPRAGEYITSRSEHRSYLKQNDFIEVGNEKDYFFKNQGMTDYNPTKDWRDK
jgi:hypothetical protein